MPVKPHFSFWIIAGLGLLWNLGGCLNYIAQTSPETVADMPEVYQAVINGRPAWATGAFAIAVFGGAVGCILLLMRRRVAMVLFGVSLIGVLASLYFTLRVVGMVPSMAMSVLVAMALIWYASIAQRKGWLK